jgi:hypothetical protein
VIKLAGIVRVEKIHTQNECPKLLLARSSRRADRLRGGSVTDPALARTLLAALRLPHEPTAFALARAPPQAELDWDNAS